ncbi:MAG: phosphatidylserine decarboxylase, partial [Limnohabitans sp.]
HGVVNPPRPGRLREWRYERETVALSQGQEMGRFLLGSTVVLLFAEGVVRLQADWTPGRPVRMGEAMGALEPGR